MEVSLLDLIQMYRELQPSATVVANQSQDYKEIITKLEGLIKAAVNNITVEKEQA